MIFSTFVFKKKLFFLYNAYLNNALPRQFFLEYLLADTTVAVKKQLMQNSIPKLNHQIS
jgi:hypothetical protein